MVIKASGDKVVSVMYKIYMRKIVHRNTGFSQNMCLGMEDNEFVCTSPHLSSIVL